MGFLSNKMMFYGNQTLAAISSASK